MTLLLITGAAGMLTAMAAPASAAGSGEFAGRLAFRLSAVNPPVVTADGPRTVTLVGRYTNTGADPIDEISFRFQRGTPLTSAAAVTAELAQPSEPVAVVNRDFRPLPGTVAPGASIPFAITVAAFGDPRDSLAIDAPGVYPVMLNVNGVVHRNGASQDARVGELHLLVTVASVPTDVAAPGAAGSGAPRAVSILWPLVDRPHLAVGGVFADDDLAAAIAPGGRLDRALTAVMGADASGADPSLVTLLVDPMLLDEVQRMADGYRVLATPGFQPALPVPAVSPSPAASSSTLAASASTAAPSSDSTVTDTAGATVPESPSAPAGADPMPASNVRTTVGIGTANAADFLERLREIAATHRVALLPYGDADLAALTRAGMLDDARFAIARGREVATRVLVRGPAATAIMDNLVSDLAFPAGGAMTAAQWNLQRAAGATGAVLSPGAVVAEAAQPAGAVGATSGVFALSGASASGDSVASGRVTLTGGQWAQAFGAVLSSGRSDATGGPGAAASAVNQLAAELEVAPPASRTPIVILPDRRFSASPTGLRDVAALVSELAPSGVLSASTVEDVLDHAAEPPAAKLTYSSVSRRAELSPSYLARLTTVRARLDLLRRAVSAADDGPEPRDVLDPLQAALLPAASTAWRGAAHPAAAQLDTVDATLSWLYGGVEINRDAGSYTLASSTAPLLLTVRNALPFEVSVRAHLVASEQSGISATDPGLVTIGAGPRSVPIKLDTEVSRSGTFTVYAQLSGPDGLQWSGPVPLTIDSRAYGALTLTLMVVAGGVLVLMVIWRLVQRLRGHGRSPGDAVVPIGTETTP